MEGHYIYQDEKGMVHLTLLKLVCPCQLTISSYVHCFHIIIMYKVKKGGENALLLSNTVGSIKQHDCIIF